MPEPTLTCKGLLHKLFYTPIDSKVNFRIIVLDSHSYIEGIPKRCLDYAKDKSNQHFHNLASMHHMFQIVLVIERFERIYTSFLGLTHYKSHLSLGR